MGMSRAIGAGGCCWLGAAAVASVCRIVVGLPPPRMSSDSVGRKKSYRWVSASQASYDGTGWNSSDEEEGEEVVDGDVGSGAHLPPTTTDDTDRLPALPKLDYSDNDTQSENTGKLLQTPPLDSVSSKNSSKSSIHIKRTPTNKNMNEDLDNLMVQISKEMTPVLPQENAFEKNAEPIPEAASVKASDEDTDSSQYRMSSAKYFEKYLESDDEDEIRQSVNKEETSPSLDQSSEKVENLKEQSAVEEEEELSDKNDSSSVNGTSFIDHYDSDSEAGSISEASSHSIILRHTSKTNLEYEGSDQEVEKQTPEEEEDGDDDTGTDQLSYTASIKYNDATSTAASHIENSEQADEKHQAVSLSTSSSSESVDQNSIKESANDDTNDNKLQSDDGIVKEVNKDEEQEQQKSGDEDDEDWKPNTEAFRSGFVQDKAPLGYVYDENGKLVNLTPASMKSSAMSTYSEVQSSWHALPLEGTDDLETIGDTKTLYDNSTLYNVPGIATRNHNLPPLPENAEQVAHNVNKNPNRASSQSKDIVKEPDSREVARLGEKMSIPYLDLNKVIASKNSHSSKLEQLNNYRRELEAYDTGIQTWISHSLKSSSKSDTDYIFEEYRVNQHVRDAYANADELNRKNTVINTVDSVTQNVSHLKKKVFSHSIKSKNLFASIGKKVINDR